MMTARLKGYGIAGNWLMNLGGSGVLMLWLLNADDPMHEGWYDALMTAAVVALILGAFFRVVVDATECLLGAGQPDQPSSKQQPRLARATTGDLRKAVAAAYVQEAKIKYRRTARR